MPDQKVQAKGKKIGRNKKKCERYRAQARREKNKKCKAARHEGTVKRLAALRARNRARRKTQPGKAA